ncbi:DUF736 domain-containing protein [Sphingomonas sp. Root241]|uniref:DUF736 domain-containing protein n=1 Tax=Sphingomonas sp. Root241 TaxID=1736501 RepID=UPI0006F73339|nr:DUF736 domain-containing protein [Sphingomonas sp. Root241]KRC80889.1 hypothetical protein ASE13_00085 [Sphingomonas sp. Root241]
MMVIGTFRPTNQGGWEGSIETLSIDRKVRLVPNDNRRSDRAPHFIVLRGWSRVGEAWRARTREEAPREFLRVELDDPAWPAPLKVALFPDADGAKAEMVWRRPPREPRSSKLQTETAAIGAEDGEA